MKDRISLVLSLLLLTTIILTLIPFFRIGFTTADDVEYYLTWLRGNLAEDANDYAQRTGRFYFLIMKPVYSLVYCFDNFYVTKFLQHTALLFSYATFSFLMYKILKSVSLSVCIFTFLVLASPISGNWHMPFIAYPGYFTLSFGLMCVALILYTKYEETGKYIWIITSAFVFFIVTLFYETYVLFLLYFFIFVFIKQLIRARNITGQYTQHSYKEYLPYALCGVLYIILYLAYKLGADGQYSGATISQNFSIKNFFTVLNHCTRGAVPMRVATREGITIKAALSNASIMTYVNAFIQCVIIGVMMARLKFEISLKKILFVIVCALFCAVSAHLLIGLAEKYNSEWYKWMQGYVTSYYSYFGIIVSIVLVGYLLLKIACKNRILKWLLFFSELAVVFVISVVTGYTNGILSKEWERSNKTFPIIDEMLQENAFSEIQENDIVYDESLYHVGSYGNCLWHPHIYWTDYINIKTGKKFHDCKNIDELKNQMDKFDDVFYMKHIETTNDFVVYLSKINKDELKMQNFSFNTIQSDNVIVYGKTSKGMQLKYNSLKNNVLEIDSVVFEKNMRIQKQILVNKGIILDSFSF